LVRPSEEEILKRWHSKARSGLAGLTRRSRISKALRGKAELNPRSFFAQVMAATAERIPLKQQL
jgi:hypothetical protein